MVNDYYNSREGHNVIISCVVIAAIIGLSYRMSCRPKYYDGLADIMTISAELQPLKKSRLTLIAYPPTEAIYYQAQFALAPVILDTSASDYDTLLIIQDKGYFREPCIEGSYDTLVMAQTRKFSAFLMVSQ